VDELVEVEDLRLEFFPEKDGIPVGDGFVDDRFFRFRGLLAYLVERRERREIGEMDRLRLLQQLCRKVTAQMGQVQLGNRGGPGLIRGNGVLDPVANTGQLSGQFPESFP